MEEIQERKLQGGRTKKQEKQGRGKRMTSFFKIEIIFYSWAASMV
jgi:hypothetical protein